MRRLSLIELLLFLSLFLGSVPTGASDLAEVDQVFYGTLQTWGSLGLRTSFGPWNNFQKSMGKLTDDRLGNMSLLGCAEQAHGMKQVLEENGLLANRWSFSVANNSFHYWIEAQPRSNQDPALILDPWKGLIRRK